MTDPASADQWRASVKAVSLPGEGRGYAYFRQPTFSTYYTAFQWARIVVTRERQRGRRIIQIHLTPQE